MRKRTIHVPDRTYISSQNGELPRKSVSVHAEPWEREQELDALGVVEKKTPRLRGPRPGKLPPDPKTLKGKFYKAGKEPEF